MLRSAAGRPPTMSDEAGVIVNYWQQLTNDEFPLGQWLRELPPGGAYGPVQLPA